MFAGCKEGISICLSIYLSIVNNTKNPLYCCLLGKENWNLPASHFLPFPFEKNRPSIFSNYEEELVGTTILSSEAAGETAFFANLPNTACLQTLWQQLILVHLRLNFFAFHFFCQSDIIRNYPLIFMCTCLIFPPLVSFLQYYVSHWMALSSISSLRQKPGNYIQVLLFSILHPSLPFSSVKCISQIYSRL